MAHTPLSPPWSAASNLLPTRAGFRTSSKSYLVKRSCGYFMEAHSAPHNPRFAVSIRTLFTKYSTPISHAPAPPLRPRPGSGRGCHVLGPGRGRRRHVTFWWPRWRRQREAERLRPEFRPLCASAEVCWLRLRLPAGVSAPAARRRVTDGCGPQPWPRGNPNGGGGAASASSSGTNLLFSPPRPRNSASMCPLSQSPKPPLPRLSCSCPEVVRRWRSGWASVGGGRGVGRVGAEVFLA